MKKTLLCIGSLVLVLILFACKTTPEPICLAEEVLINGVCCADVNKNNVCDSDETPPEEKCGDGTCTGKETCETYSNDCGPCKKAIGESYDRFNECASGFCVHNMCRESATYCGDGHCDA